MSSGQDQLTGPDFAAGVAPDSIADGRPVLGHAHGEAIVMVRQGAEVFAVGASCTHYGGPLAEGRVVGATIRCPWHHACFDLRTGEVARAPALNPIPCFHVEQRGDRLVVLGKRAPARVRVAPAPAWPESVVIVGGGAAGHQAAETLRREGYDRPITVLSADASPPCDRPNLSKDYLAGTAPEEWIPLRAPEFYREQEIALRLGARVARLDPTRRRAMLAGGEAVAYGALLLATGADPVRLPIPGADLPHVSTLRTLADSRAIIARAGAARRAVVVGASFIGLETAASLRTRGLCVDVVAPEARPLERVFGAALGDRVRRIHEQHGVRFHFADGVTSVDASGVALKSGGRLEADLVVLGVGVRPSVALAEEAGLAVDRGVLVDERLRTSDAHVFAAGDVARYPDPRSGERIRVEHWVVAQRMGRTAARAMLGHDVRFDAVPFFWSQHYDVPIAYVGHAESWDRIATLGDVAGGECAVAYQKDGKVLAVASIFRDDISLEAEELLERDDQARLAELIP